MPFLMYLAMVILATHILAPLGSLFVGMLNQHNPYLFTGFSPQIHYLAELFLLYLPGAIIVLMFCLKTHLFDRIPKKNPIIQKFLLVGIGIFILFVFGHNMENNLGNTLNNYLGIGVLLSRMLLLTGCIKVFLNIEESSPAKPEVPPGAGGGKGGSSDEEAALAALMGMMGGGKGAPGRSAGGGGFIKK